MAIMTACRCLWTINPFKQTKAISRKKLVTIITTYILIHNNYVIFNNFLRCNIYKNAITVMTTTPPVITYLLAPSHVHVMKGIPAMELFVKV